MTEYGWQGPGRIREMELDRTKAPVVNEPAGVALPGGPAAPTILYQCNANGCGKRFKKSMIAARHFNTNHEDLYQDKESWRAHVSEVKVS